MKGVGDVGKSIPISWDNLVKDLKVQGTLKKEKLKGSRHAGV